MITALFPGERQGGVGHFQPPESGHPGGHRLSVHAGQIPGRYCNQSVMGKQKIYISLFLEVQKVVCFDKSLFLEYNVDLI